MQKDLTIKEQKAIASLEQSLADGEMAQRFPLGAWLRGDREDHLAIKKDLLKHMKKGWSVQSYIVDRCLRALGVEPAPSIDNGTKQVLRGIQNLEELLETMQESLTDAIVDRLVRSGVDLSPARRWAEEEEEEERPRVAGLNRFRERLRERSQVEED